MRLFLVLTAFSLGAWAAVPAVVEGGFTSLGDDFESVLVFGVVLFAVIGGGLVLMKLVRKVFNAAVRSEHIDL